MADGVKIRIVGDDSEFVKTLENLEKRTRSAFGGVTAQLPSLAQGIRGVLSGLTGRLNLGMFSGNMAGGMLAQKDQVVSAARDLASAARQAMAGTGGAYGAGAQMAEGFRKGLSGKRSSIIAAAQSVASAAVNALKAALQIRSPSRVTMRMGEYAGQGFEIGLSQSLKSAVRSAGRAAGELNLSPRMTGTAAKSLSSGDALQPGRPIYLNVDGRTLAQVIGDDMRSTLNRRARSIDAGRGR